MTAAPAAAFTTEEHEELAFIRRVTVEGDAAAIVRVLDQLETNPAYRAEVRRHIFEGEVFVLPVESDPEPLLSPDELARWEDDGGR